MRYTSFKIFQLDELSNRLNYLGTWVNCALTLVANSFKLSAMPIHVCAKSPTSRSGNFYRSQINDSRIIALLKMPWEFWH